ncbi:MAG TPA: amidohydrolase family protein, partial [Ferruginibacter sp.]|nr:amidohydrolase family protein [Ferruginibacter sp.]
SALTMYQAYLNLVSHAGIDQAEALRMCSLYPAKAIGMDHELGRIATGFISSLALLPLNHSKESIRVLY